MMSTGDETPATDTTPSTSGNDRRRRAYAAIPPAAASTTITASPFTTNRRMPQSYRLPIADFRLQRGLLKPALDRMYEGFNYPDSAADPIQIVRRYKRPDDREVVA